MWQILVVTFIALASLVAGCAKAPAEPASTPVPKPTASNKFTAADIAKLKWLEGTWRGMDGDKPFFERYRFENDGTMVVETFEDESLSKVSDRSRFALTDGEFGHTEAGRRSAASEITDDHVQFVPVSGGGNSFRFERQPNDTWRAVLDLPDPAKPPKIYVMEPWPKP